MHEHALLLPICLATIISHWPFLYPNRLCGQNPSECTLNKTKAISNQSEAKISAVCATDTVCMQPTDCQLIPPLPIWHRWAPVWKYPKQTTLTTYLPVYSAAHSAHFHSEWSAAVLPDTLQLAPQLTGRTEKELSKYVLSSNSVIVTTATRCHVK